MTIFTPVLQGAPGRFFKIFYWPLGGTFCEIKLPAEFTLSSTVRFLSYVILPHYYFCFVTKKATSLEILKSCA